MSRVEIIHDPLGNRIVLSRAILHGHIYRRHPELRKKEQEIIRAIVEPDCIAKSKKDSRSLLYFRQTKFPFFLMVVATPNMHGLTVRTAFFVFNMSKGDPIIWRKKIST